jgi:hypothetical protein
MIDRLSKRNKSAIGREASPWEGLASRNSKAWTLQSLLPLILVFIAVVILEMEIQTLSTARRHKREPYLKVSQSTARSYDCANRTTKLGPASPRMCQFKHGPPAPPAPPACTSADAAYLRLGWAAEGTDVRLDCAKPFDPWDYLVLCNIEV